MNRDAGDIIDRYSIAILKAERIGTDEAKEERQAFNKGFLDLTLRIPQRHTFWQKLLDIAVATNSCIWELESDLRREMLDNDLEETGRRAIMIRRINNIRVQLKNYINFTVGEGVQDVKRDHISENGRRDGGDNKEGEVVYSGAYMQDRSGASGELLECGRDTGDVVHGYGEGERQGSDEQGSCIGNPVYVSGRDRDNPEGTAL